MRRRLLLKLTGLPFLMALPSHAQQVTTLQISTLMGSDPATIIAQKIIIEAYRRLNIHVDINELPGERSLLSADSGLTDGELYRKAGIEALYRNLVMVPVPLMNYEIVVFSRSLNFPVNGWESLRPYTIGFVKSIKIIEENTKGMKIEVATSLRNAFLKMMLGRSDVVVTNRLSGLAMIKELALSEIALLSPALVVFPVYHYLNKKHADLIPDLTSVLNKMQNEKAIRDIQKTVKSDLGVE
ncbi:substrate-binding periplasmic protein [Undibacterium sp. SXout11W]|uniref:substrate-binding periplasmic protein n=1 Tax=Undibacterium sp. SXout11W TaxID=3413050 RepID=UPI003BF2E1DE